MDESVRAADVDEGAEVADRGDATLADLALLQLLDQLLLHLVAPLLHGLALGEDQPVAMAVDLDDLEGQRAADQPGHVGLLAGIVAAANLGHLRRRHESAHAVEIHQQTALVVVGDFGLDDLVRLVELLQSTPALLLPRPVDRDDRVTFLVLGLDDEDEDGVADRESLPFSSLVRLENSRDGTMPSDFDPMSTRISSRSIRMMTPSMTSPYLSDL